MSVRNTQESSKAQPFLNLIKENPKTSFAAIVGTVAALVFAGLAIASGQGVNLGDLSSFSCNNLGILSGGLAGLSVATVVVNRVLNGINKKEQGKTTSSSTEQPAAAIAEAPQAEPSDLPQPLGFPADEAAAAAPQANPSDLPQPLGFPADEAAAAAPQAEPSVPQQTSAFPRGAADDFFVLLKLRRDEWMREDAQNDLMRRHALIRGELMRQNALIRSELIGQQLIGAEAADREAVHREEREEFSGLRIEHASGLIEKSRAAFDKLLGDLALLFQRRQEGLMMAEEGGRCEVARAEERAFFDVMRHQYDHDRLASAAACESESALFNRWNQEFEALFNLETAGRSDITREARREWEVGCSNILEQTKVVRSEVEGRAFLYREEKGAFSVLELEKFLSLVAPAPSLSKAPASSLAQELEALVNLGGAGRARVVIAEAPAVPQPPVVVAPAVVAETVVEALASSALRPLPAVLAVGLSC